MKKLQSINSPLFKTMEPEQMKKLQGGYAEAFGTWTEAGVKVTSGSNSSDSTASDPESPAGDDGKDS